LLLKLNAEPRVTWQGRFRPALHDAPVSPRPANGKLPIWIGSGGTRESVLRAGALGLPLSMANISIPPAKLAPVVGEYRQAFREARHGSAAMKVSLASHLHVHKDSQTARDTFYPHYANYFRNHTPSQYRAREVTREEFERLAGPDGAVYAGSPQEIVDKALHGRELFGHQRFMVQLDIGGMPFAEVARMIELLASEVVPKIHDP
jgi:alkanesulfonate monooxygenase SsuD/methylene tetrahydromethanopterin reductase-like flavin-dependent oxidoreductase (luciferase family)